MGNGSSNESARGNDHDEVAVGVITLSGIFPTEDTLQRVDAALTIATVLGQAAAALELTNTEDWVARVDGREINAQETFKKAHLRCIVDIVWQPREGGGGA